MDLKYPVVLTLNIDGTFIVTFPDVPEAITVGKNEEDALQRAQDALMSAYVFCYKEMNRSFPQPSQPKPGQRTVTLSLNHFIWTSKWQSTMI